MRVYSIGFLTVFPFYLLFIKDVCANSPSQAKSNTAAAKVEEIPILKPDLSFSSLNNSEYSFFSYSISNGYKNKLLSTNKLEYLTFNALDYFFHKDSHLPAGGTNSLNVYTCKRNRAVLISLVATGQLYYYYDQDPRTGLWTNCAMNCLEKCQKVDANGVKHYESIKHEDIQTFYEELKKLCAQLYPAREGDSDNEDDDDGFESVTSEPESPVLEMSIIPPGGKPRKPNPKTIMLPKPQNTQRKQTGNAGGRTQAKSSPSAVGQPQATQTAQSNERNEKIDAMLAKESESLSNASSKSSVPPVPPVPQSNENNEEDKPQALESSVSQNVQPQAQAKPGKTPSEGSQAHNKSQSKPTSSPQAQTKGQSQTQNKSQTNQNKQSGQSQTKNSGKPQENSQRNETKSSQPQVRSNNESSQAKKNDPQSKTQTNQNKQASANKQNKQSQPAQTKNQTQAKGADKPAQSQGNQNKKEQQQSKGQTETQSKGTGKSPQSNKEQGKGQSNKAKK